MKPSLEDIRDLDPQTRREIHRYYALMAVPLELFRLLMPAIVVAVLYFLGRLFGFPFSD